MKVTKEHRAWSRQVRERDGWYCRRCFKFFPEGRTQGLDAHHVFSKGAHPRVRYDVENGVSLCMGCHRSWAHARPLEFYEWIRGELGARRFNALRQRSVKTKASA